MDKQVLSSPTQVNRNRNGTEGAFTVCDGPRSEIAGDPLRGRDVGWRVFPNRVAALRLDGISPSMRTEHD